MKKLALVVGLAFLASCSKCGARPATVEPITRVIARGAVGALIIPSLAETGARVHQLEQLKAATFAAQLRGFPSGKAYADAVIEQLGFDFRDPASLERAGLDGKGSAAMVMLANGSLYVALPVKDAARFGLAMGVVASQRLGAPVVAEKKVGELTLHTYARKPDADPRVAWALAHGYALVTDTNGLTQLAGLATLTETDSLTSDQTWAAAVAALPKPLDGIVYLPPGTPALMHAPFGTAIAAIGLTSTALTISADGTLKQNRQTPLPLVPAADAKQLDGYLPADAFLTARYTGAPAELGPFLAPLLGRYLTRAFAEGGFDPTQDALAKLEPGVSVALSLAEQPPMDQGMPALDLRQTNPFTWVHLSGAAEVKDPQTIVPTLERVAALAPKFGATMTLKERPDGQKAMLTTYAQGEGVHFAPSGSKLFFASPVQRLDALVKSDGKGKTSPTDAGLAVSLDLHRLADSVRALPERAWGLGGFAIKATTVRWLDAVDDLEAIELRATQKDQKVHLELSLGLAPSKQP